MIVGHYFNQQLNEYLLKLTNLTYLELGYKFNIKYKNLKNQFLKFNLC